MAGRRTPGAADPDPRQGQLFEPRPGADHDPAGGTPQWPRGAEASTAIPLISAGPARVGPASISYLDAKTLLTPASGFAKQYKFSLNPYSGCGFGCEYCYARFFAPSAEEVDTWGRWVKVKQNAVGLLRRASRSRSAARRIGPGDTIYMSTVTDPYQPVEQKLGLTRAILEELVQLQPRLTIQTRSPIAARDIDLFK